MNNHFDVLVVGSGGGMLVARGAAAMGKRVAFIEKGAVGGTCLNRGCIPSKMLVYPPVFADTVRKAGAINVQNGADVGVDFSGLVHRISATVEDISSSLRDSLSSSDAIEFIAGEAVFTGEKSLRVGERELSAEYIFIATGTRPAVPGIPGLAGTPYMTSTDALQSSSLPQRMIVIGAGYIAVEIGCAYAAAGCRVDYVVRSRFLRSLDREAVGEFERVFSECCTVHRGFSPKAAAYENGMFTLTCTDGDGRQHDLTADALLAATGVVPDTDRLGLDNTGIRTDENGYIVVDAYLRTGVKGVYALGDVVGNYFFRHTVNYEAAYLLKTAFSDDPAPPLDYGPVPYAVFTHPEIAGVGMTEEQAREKNIDYAAGRARYAESNQALARGLACGLVKILVEKPSRRLIGAHITGEEASNMIHLFVALMKKQGTLDDLLDMIFIHPALPEVARDAARDAHNRLSQG